MPDISSLMPQPPQQQSGIAGMGPLQILQLLDQAQRLQTDVGVGQAFKNAYDPTQPTGVNIGRLQDLLVQNPNVARRLPEIMTQVQNLRTATTTADTSATDLGLKRTQAIQDFLGGIADTVQSKGQLQGAIIAHARNNPAIPSDYYTNFFNSAPDDPKAFRTWMMQQRNAALGSAGVSGRVQGPPTAQGAPTSISTGQANAGGGPAGIPTGNPTGFEPRVGASVASANQLQDAFDTSVTRKAMLGNLENDLGKFTSGPGADWSKVAKAWVNRNIPMPKDWQFDPKSIASQEAFNKQAYLLAAQQFGAIGGTGTDAKFSAAFDMNPNETLSSMGNSGIIRMLKGNEDAIQAKARAWRSYEKTNGTQSYPDFSLDFNAHFDPRVFQFKYIPESERAAYVAQMSPEERQQLAENIEYAHKQGWVNYMRSK